MAFPYTNPFYFLAESRSLAVRSPVEYVPMLNDLDTDYLLVAFCKPCEFQSYYVFLFANKECRQSVPRFAYNHVMSVQ